MQVPKKLIFPEQHRLLYHFENSVNENNIPINKLETTFSNWVSNIITEDDFDLNSKQKEELLAYFTDTFMPKYKSLSKSTRNNLSQSSFGKILNSNYQEYEKKKRKHLLYTKLPYDSLQRPEQSKYVSFIDKIEYQNHEKNEIKSILTLLRSKSFTYGTHFDITRRVNQAFSINYNHLVRAEIENFGVWQNWNYNWDGSSKTNKNT